jgi:D-tyrosyl-tRNA(Tyr) deacylase
VAGRQVGAIGAGLVILLGVGASDTTAEAELLAQKVANLRIFSDSEGQVQFVGVGCASRIVGRVAVHALR